MRPSLSLIVVLGLTSALAGQPDFVRLIVVSDAFRAPVDRALSGPNNYKAPFRVELVDAQQKVVGDGVPDPNGVCQLPSPPAGEYRARLFLLGVEVPHQRWNQPLSLGGGLSYRLIYDDQPIGYRQGEADPLESAASKLDSKYINGWSYPDFDFREKLKGGETAVHSYSRNMLVTMIAEQGGQKIALIKEEPPMVKAEQPLPAGSYTLKALLKDQLLQSWQVGLVPGRVNVELPTNEALAKVLNSR